MRIDFARPPLDTRARARARRDVTHDASSVSVTSALPATALCLRQRLHFRRYAIGVFNARIRYLYRA